MLEHKTSSIFEISRENKKNFFGGLYHFSLGFTQTFATDEKYKKKMTKFEKII